MHTQIARDLHQRIEQGEFAHMVARRARARSVPDQHQVARQHAFAGRGRHLHIGLEVIAVFETAGQHAFGLGIAPDDVQGALRLPIVAREAQHGVIGRMQHLGVFEHAAGLHIAHTVDRQIGAELPDALAEIDGHQVLQPLPSVGMQGFADLQHDAALAMGGQRIHAQAEIVAGGLFEQGRIGVAACDLFEDLLAFVFGDRHRGHQLALDVERETADGLAVAQREFERAFEHAVVRVAQNEFDARGGEAADDAGVDRDPGQLHRGARVLHDDARRDEFRARRLGQRRHGQRGAQGEQGGRYCFHA